MTIRPAAAEFGVWFRRSDVKDRDALIAARWESSVPAQLCTKLVNGDGVSVATVEHIMAALAGCGIHNALIELDGPEVPVLDGSSARYVKAFMKAGIQKLDAPVRALEILAPVEVRDGAAWARLEPGDALEIDFRIEFPDEAIGTQHKVLNMANGAFVRELCDSRTFCRKADIDLMHEQGLALGGSLDNAVVYDGVNVVTPGGLRHQDEAVRHKMLDAMGDLALAGAPILGKYSGHRAGHTLTGKLLKALFSQPGAYRTILCDETTARRLPGVGIQRSDIPAVA